MINFHKTFGDFDRLEIKTSDTSDWLIITKRVGFTETVEQITLRGTEAVRDLHYVLGRYLTRLGPHQ